MSTLGTVPTEDQLSEAGFQAAADMMTRKREMMKKLRIAFEHFRVVETEHITRFNSELRKRTESVIGKNTWGEIKQYDRLRFTPIEEYGACPPKEVLLEVLKAKDMHCFDRFEVCTIESVQVIPDPIIFGVIDGCTNKYFVAQWDNDVSIEDILRPEEG